MKGLFGWKAAPAAAAPSASTIPPPPEPIFDKENLFILMKNPILTNIEENAELKKSIKMAPIDNFYVGGYYTINGGATQKKLLFKMTFSSIIDLEAKPEYLPVYLQGTRENKEINNTDEKIKDLMDKKKYACIENVNVSAFYNFPSQGKNIMHDEIVRKLTDRKKTTTAGRFLGSVARIGSKVATLGRKPLTGGRRRSTRRRKNRL